MSQSQLSAAPMDPYEWRESVLSTRSLSYLSTADALGSSGLRTHSRHTSDAFARSRSRRDTLTATEDLDDDLVMAGTRRDEVRGHNDVSELPESVAESALFTLPREIRERIYAFCLTAQNGLPVEWPPLPGATLGYTIQTQILRTCKLVHSEAAPLLYSLNTLVFHHPSDANIFARAIASSALARRFIANLSLQIKAADTRLWMPYLTSADGRRSLQADFPALRELGVRFRSNKWNHMFQPEQNIRHLMEDRGLDEVVNGLRTVRRKSEGDPDGMRPLNEMNSEEFMRLVDAHRPGDEMIFKQQLLDLHKAHVPAATKPHESPTIKVVCACRVNAAHFNTVTSPSDPGPPGLGPNNLPQQHAPHAQAHPIVPNLGVASAHHNQPHPLLQQAIPVVEGERYRGFSIADFKTSGVERFHDTDLGSAKVSRTPFADKNGILVALEIHCLDPKRDMPART